MNLLRVLWHDEAGAVLSAELVLLGTVGVVGATVGLGAVSEALNDELTEAAYAFRSLDQSYLIQGQAGGGAWTAGSCFVQQDVDVSRAELREWIEQQEPAEGRQDGDPASPPRAGAAYEEGRQEFERRRREQELRMRQRQEEQRERQREDADRRLEPPPGGATGVID